MSISELERHFAEARRAMERAIRATRAAEAAGKLRRLTDDEKSLASDRELMWNIYG